jgi:hypothetical protein
VRIHSKVGDEDKWAPDWLLCIDITKAGYGAHSPIVSVGVLLVTYQFNGFEDSSGTLEIDLPFDEEPGDLWRMEESDGEGIDLKLQWSAGLTLPNELRGAHILGPIGFSLCSLGLPCSGFPGLGLSGVGSSL